MKTKKRIPLIALILAIAICAVCLGGCNNNWGVEKVKKTTPTTTIAGPASTELVATNLIEIVVKDFGSIKVELYREAAPITVDNFIKLINEKYFDGLTFHRIIKNFMIQGGQGATELTPIKGEFYSNGWNNPIEHTRGTISMARTNMVDSATSQFFICDATSPHLDGQYAAFGRVTEGMEVVDSIANTPVTDNNGTVAAANQPVIETIKDITE
ncbi:MAG: peptidylprolyl isomerase [Oscillospiraceae bacterium]|nr:peptidylprolyl isomerase [Oscillospiraceae bacterium]